MSNQGDKLYFEDIKEALGKIESYTKNLSFKKFINDSKTVDAVIRNLIIVGEAVKNISKEIKLRYPEIAWKEASGMRNKVIHEYSGIDEEILWKTIKEDLPVFKKQIVRISKDIN